MTSSQDLLCQWLLFVSSNQCFVYVIGNCVILLSCKFDSMFWSVWEIISLFILAQILLDWLISHWLAFTRLHLKMGSHLILPHRTSMLPPASKARLVKSQLQGKICLIHLQAITIIIIQVRLEVVVYCFSKSAFSHFYLFISVCFLAEVLWWIKMFVLKLNASVINQLLQTTPMNIRLNKGIAQ